MTLDGGERELGTCVISFSSSAPSIARSFIEETLLRHHLEGPLERAQLLTSEAVTNSVIHARSPSTLRIQLVGDTVRITVTDAGFGRLAIRGIADHGTSGGRGLFIIDQLSLRWGTNQSESGTEVWFDLPLD